MVIVDKNLIKGQALWLKSVILTTQEAEIERIMV
jgi:hypothetical protein